MAEVEVPIGDSSTIDAAFYDADERKLRIQFKAGIYEYSNVGQETVDGLSNAGSPGSYWHQMKGNFPYVRVG